MPVTNTIPLYAGKKQWLALVVLMIPVLLISIDNTVLSFALPEIARVFEPSGIQLLWMMDAYPLVLAGLLVPMGVLGDRVGRRRILLTGCIGFAGLSALAAFAQEANMLILSRALLGFFGAMLMPATLSLLRNIFVNDRQRSLAIAIWSSGFSAGAVLGPLVGGFLLNHFWWGSIFLIATVLLIPALIFIPMLLPESKDPQPGKIDLVSALLIVLGISGLVYALKAGFAEGLSLLVCLIGVAGVIFLYLFIVRQMRIPVPLLDLSLFANKRFSSALVNNLLSMVCFTGFIYFYSQYLQLLVELSPLKAGFAMIPAMASNILFSLIILRFTKIVSMQNIVFWALILVAFGYLLIAYGASSAANTFALLMAGFILTAAGNGASQTLCNDAIVSVVPPHKAGAASAISEVAYELGAVLGTALLGTILNTVYSRQLQVPASFNAQEAETARQTLAGALNLATQEAESALAHSANSAFSTAIFWTSLTATALMLLAALSWVLSQKKRKAQDHS